LAGLFFAGFSAGFLCGVGGVDSKRFNTPSNFALLGSSGILVCFGLSLLSMVKRFVYADEAGCFEFSKKQNVSRYFIVCVISLDDPSIGNKLLDLRRDLVWSGQQLGQYFHCCKDRPAIREHVFKLISDLDFRVYAQIMEKSKAQPKIRRTKDRFYQYGWFYLFKYVAKRIVSRDTHLMVTAASLGSKAEQVTFTDAVKDAIAQTVPIKRSQWVTDFPQASADPCLQIADYCAWAIQRKWESGGKDTHFYQAISGKVVYEYDFFQRGTEHFY
jgi:hypothetical protein